VEGSAVTLGSIVTDPGADTPSVSWSVNRNGSPFASGNGASISLTFANNGSYEVTLRAVDEDGAAGSTTATIQVNNAVPLISGITAPAAPVAVNTLMTVSASYGDAGVLDTHLCSFDWDVAGVAPTSVSGSNGTCSATRSFQAAGVYEIGVTVTDSDGGSATAVYRYVVVYDPAAGFVTGGGWILSPAGAFTADATLTGKANFGFVSKYQKGQSTPTGQTEFQFKAAAMNFSSTSYEWLVISGARAQYKGSGRINGAGNYGFLLTATDGQVTGGGGIDQFRIKIWDRDRQDAVVYDNALGAPDDLTTARPQNLTEPNGNGSIVIHK
jgi:hypothetical protein